ncbi:DUF3024 domain-containing protein [Flavicella sp.]|uniref:DUF3024 domain-containing protein n=1 Tax=Flavicella sp. TaxID=2957742 RepID=UPI00301A89E3
MKVIDFSEIQIKAYIDKIRPPKELRSQVDVSCSYKNNTFEIFEIRPNWADKNIIQNLPIAKAKYVKTKKTWSVYWMTSNEKWILYKPKPRVEKLSDFIELLVKDENGCFWG